MIVCAVANNVRVVRLPKTIDATQLYQKPYVLGMELTDLLFDLLDFVSALAQSFFITHVFFPSGIGMITLCHCALQVCRLLYYFTRAQSLILVCLMEHIRFLRMFRLLKTTMTFIDRLNAFCIVKWR